MLKVGPLALLLLLGCAADHEDQPATVVEPPPDAPPYTTVPPVPADPLQAELLVDGEVTPAEMERALLAVVSCIEARGIDAELVSFDPKDGYEFRTHNDESLNDAADDALDHCQAAFLSDIEIPFIEQYGPTEQEIQAERDEQRRCLEDLGYSDEDLDSPNSFEIIDQEDAYNCDPDNR